MTKRVPDWENRLSEVILEWRDKDFDWSEDCGRQLAECVIALTGEDPLADLRDKYNSKEEALKLLAIKPMEDYLDERFDRVHPSRALRGDIALTGEACLGCVLGGQAMFFEDGGKTVMIPRSEWTGTWAVGDH